MQTRDQKYAAKVYEKVAEFEKKSSEEERNQYGSMAHKLPVLIRTAGLAQALSFVEARGKDPHKELLEHLAKVIGEKDRGKLTERSRKGELADYTFLTNEVLTVLLWFKRFAQSVLKVEGAEEGDDKS